MKLKSVLSGIGILGLLLLMNGCSGESDVEESNPPTNAQTETEVQEEAPREITADEPVTEEAEETTADYCATDFGVYVYDPGEEYTNVRNAPGGDVVLQLPLGDLENEYLLEISGYENGWFKIAGDVIGMEEDLEIPGGIGWIHHSVVACDTRNYANQFIDLREEPSETSPVTAIITQESGGLRPLEACGEWVLIELEYDDFYGKGWIQTSWLCGNPLTTCS